ncbi:SPOR domain-containing protein [Neptunomonas antarctica]|uniref:SPOR domain-containing protein n=1 Tax=Neptunomonas antarctica TaxID=619304 RepID=UPI001EE43E22|nr:SPOR domain-containing protein [Neptunomonas antarctica]
MKKRILGASVMVLAAVVLFPLFLTGEGYRERHLESHIPTAPAVADAIDVTPQTQLLPDTSEYPAAQVATELVVSESKSSQKVVVTVQPKPDQEMPPQKKRPVISVDNSRPLLDEQNVPVAWTLQLASFSDESNARALRTLLIGAGHKVYTRRNADLYKVYVGPDMQRDRLEKLKETLKSDFGLDGIIFRFTTQ